MAKKTTLKNRWINADLHIHTPASADYRDPSATYLDILYRAENRSLEIIAFTDHNTVNGYATMQREIEQLRYMRDSGRVKPDELNRLQEYERLLQKILVLPGFEFTATFGFHVLAIFPPTKSIREIDHILLSLNVPIDAIEKGNSEVGASSDVLRAYESIYQAGGLVIAAHANSANGVAMRNVKFGGQTRIAYTQSEFLHALELTDLNASDSTARLFDGTRSEYSRRMRCIQGSDAHALDTQTDKNGKLLTLGVGERTTEYLMTEPTFGNLLELFQNNDFTRSRPYKRDDVQVSRTKGATSTQSFHVSAQQHGGHLHKVLVDVCAFANTDGGTIYIGLDADPNRSVAGVQNAPKVMSDLSQAINRNVFPALKTELDILETHGQNVIRVQVPMGKQRPYAVGKDKIYMRNGTDSSLAVRDEIVNLVEQNLPEEWVSTTQSFHVSAQQQGGHLHKILMDVCAFANTDGGTIYIGLEADPNKPPIAGIPNALEVVNELTQTIDRTVSPQLKVELDILQIEGENVIRIRVPLGKERPYALSKDKIYVRSESESSLASRDEVVRLVAHGLRLARSSKTIETEATPPPPSVPEIFDDADSIPKTGVEVVGTERRDGQDYYIVRDLRTGYVIHRVEQASAHKLWQYAINQRENNPIDESKIQWASSSSDIGLWRVYKIGQDKRYDLVMRGSAGLRVFYGVSEVGMSGVWLQLIKSEAP